MCKQPGQNILWLYLFILYMTIPVFKVKKKKSIFSSWMQINSLAVLIFNETFSPGCGMLAFCILFICYRDFKLWFELFWVWYKRSCCMCDSIVVSIYLVCGWNDVNIQLLTLLTWKYVKLSFRLVHVQKEKNG